MNQATIESLHGKLKAVAPYVSDDVGLDWIENTYKNVLTDLKTKGESISPVDIDGIVAKKVEWHIRRLDGFGGSDMGVLLTEYEGGFYPHETSAKDIVREKLCLEPAGVSTGDMERGHTLEPFAETKFLSGMANKEDEASRLYLERHPDLDKFLQEANTKDFWPEHPWVRSSPDGLYVDQHGETWLVDYKCPAVHDTVMDMYTNPPRHYRAQLAQYKMHLEKYGIKVDHVVLCPFSTKEFKVYPAEFKVDGELIQQVKEAGDFYFDFVKKTELPVRPPGQDFHQIRQVPAPLRDAICKFIYTKKNESLGKNASEKSKERLLELASVYGIDWNHDGRKVRLPGVDISQKHVERYDQGALIEEVRRLGGDPDDPKLKISKPQTTIRVIQSKKTEHTPFIESVQQIAEGQYDEGMLDALDLFDEDPSLVGIADPILQNTTVNKPSATVESSASQTEKEPDVEDEGLNFL